MIYIAKKSKFFYLLEGSGRLISTHSDLEDLADYVVNNHSGDQINYDLNEKHRHDSFRELSPLEQEKAVTAIQTKTDEINGISKEDLFPQD
jgi:hypothetical protein